MRVSSGLKAVKESLRRRGAPGAYVERLIGELADHHADLICELTGAGMSPDDAQAEADRRIGDPQSVADAVFERLRRDSFVGRHRPFCLIVLPVLFLPLSWAGLLGLAGWTTGMFSPEFHVGMISAWSRGVMSATCVLCDYFTPAAIGGAFYLLARNRFCGRAWCRAPALAISVVSSLLFVQMFVTGSGTAAGRLVVGAAFLPDPVKVVIPLGVILAIETLSGVRGGSSNSSLQKADHVLD